MSDEIVTLDELLSLNVDLLPSRETLLAMTSWWDGGGGDHNSHTGDNNGSFQNGGNVNQQTSGSGSNGGFSGNG